MPYIGHGSAIMLGFESTWGTEVARTNSIRCVSHAMTRTIEKVGRPHLGTLGSAYFTRRSHYVQSDMSGGSFEVLAAYNDSTVALMAYALGAAVDAGGPTYTHTLTCAEQGLIGLSIETINGTGNAEVWEGCKISRAEFMIETGGIARLKCDVIAETNSGLESASTPTFATEDHILHSHAGQFTHNSNSKDFASLSIVRDRKLATRQLVGSALTKEPIVSDFPDVTGTVVFEYDSTTPNAAYIADTQGDATVTFTSGTSPNALAITLHNIILNSVVREVSAVGVIRETVTFTCEATGSESGCSFVFTNTQALYTTNA